MKFFILFLSTLLAVSSARGAALTESKFSQVVKDVKVVVRASETTAAAKVNDIFKAPDLIRTGADSLAELIAPDKTITRVGANTVFSFEKAGRAINLEQGSVIFHSPKGKGGGSIRTKGASAAVLGTTIVVTATPGGGFKAIVLEGKGQITLPNGNFRILTAGQVTFVLPGSQTFGPQLNINLGKLVESSRLVQGFESELPSKPVIQAAVERQLLLIRTGKAEDTNIILGNKATTDTVETVDPVTVQQAVDERKDELAIARKTDVTISGSSLSGTAVKHLFLDRTVQDFAALGVLNFSGFVGEDITLATSAIDFTPYLGQTDFTIGATEYLKIQSPALVAAATVFDLELSATPVAGHPPLLRSVKLVGKTGLTIQAGFRIRASQIGDVSFISGAVMNLQNVTFQNLDGQLELNGLSALTLNGGGINAQSLLVKGGLVNLQGGNYSASLNAVVRSSTTTLDTSLATVSGNNVSFEAQSTADLHSTTASATTLLNLNAQQDLKIGGGSYSVSGQLGTANLYAGRDLFMGSGTDIQANTIQMNAGNNATLTSPVIRGFNTLNVTAAQGLAVNSGSFNGVAGMSTAQAAFTAGETLTMNGPSFGNVSTIALTARTINLSNVDFLNGTIVNLSSQLGQLAANPNTGAASVPGHVNFIQNVSYNGNPAQLFVGSTINISVRP